MKSWVLFFNIAAVGWGLVQDFIVIVWIYNYRVYKISDGPIKMSCALFMRYWKVTGQMVVMVKLAFTVWYGIKTEANSDPIIEWQK